MNGHFKCLFTSHNRLPGHSLPSSTSDAGIYVAEPLFLPGDTNQPIDAGTIVLTLALIAFGEKQPSSE